MQVGDYVRLDKNRGIRKIKAYDENIDCYVFDKPVLDRWGKNSYSHFGIKEQILKSSPNIIDLIEVGDYVNGLKVANIEDNVITMVGLLMRLGQEDIKSIVTKEQFEVIGYKVGLF